nr:hypothetical protein GCM10020093_018680 [Planobispora longispora]
MAKGSDTTGWFDWILTSSISQVDSAAGATNEMVWAPADPVVRPTYWRAEPGSRRRKVPASWGDPGGGPDPARPR